MIVMLMSRCMYMVLSYAMSLVYISCTQAADISSPKCCQQLSAWVERDPPPDNEARSEYTEATVEARYPRGNISATLSRLEAEPTTFYFSTDGGETWNHDAAYRRISEVPISSEIVEFFPNEFHPHLRLRMVRGDPKDMHIERSWDGGTTWTRLKSHIKGCEAILSPTWGGCFYHPGIPATIYVIGDMPGVPIWRQGMYVSEDAGDSFSFMYETDRMNRGFAVSVSDPRIMYGAASGGSLLKSTDAGKTWRLVERNDDIRRPYLLRGESISPATAEKLGSDRITDIDIDPSNPDIVYVVCGKGLLRTMDGGHTWCVLDLGIREAEGITNVEIYEKNPTIILAGTWKGLMRSTDRGCHWERIDILSRIRK